MNHETGSFTVGHVSSPVDVQVLRTFLHTDFNICSMEQDCVSVSDLLECDAVLLTWNEQHSIIPMIRNIKIASDRIPIVVVGVPENSKLATKLFRAGVSDVFCDTEDKHILNDNLIYHIEKSRIEKEHADLEDALSTEVGQKTYRLEKALNDLQKAYDDTLEALVLALDSREHATGSHSKRVALYSLFTCIKAGLPEDRWLDAYRGGLLHDIGKIGIPDAILLKPGKLTEEEFEIIKTHTNIGREFLANVDFLKDALAIPTYHHEKIDGSGYPEGLSGEDIPLEARIFAVIDVYDALRSKRPYKEPMSHKKATDIISGDSGTHFDAEIARLFCSELEETWDNLWAEVKDKNHYEQILESCLKIQNKFT